MISPIGNAAFISPFASAARMKDKQIELGNRLYERNPAEADKYRTQELRMARIIDEKRKKDKYEAL